MASLTKVKLNNIDTSVTFVYDPLVLLNYGSTLANTDVGFVFNRDGGISSNVALYWNESTDRITIAYTNATGLPNSNVSISKYANVAADWYFGNLAGGTTNTVWVSANVLPTANAFYNFGSPTQRWNVGYFAATTLDLGGSQISVDPANGFKFTVGGTGTPTYLSSNGLIAGTTLSSSGDITGGAGLSIAGTINAGANILAAQVSAGSLITTGVVNAGGNVLARTGIFNYLDVNGNIVIGDVTVPGTGHSIVGNVVQSGAGTVYYNTPGNIMAALGRFGQISSDGLINTSGNVMASTGRFGTVLSDGFINTSANVSAALHTGGSVVVSGVINTAGNILTKEIDIFGNAQIGSLSTAGVVHDIIGNVRQSGAGTIFFNTSGNIMAAVGRFGSISTDGYINTSANISTVQLNAGQINTTGNLLAQAGVFNALTVNGNESVTGYLNVTGNIIATTAEVGSVESAGAVYANSTAATTSTTSGALRTAGGAGIAGNTVIGGILTGGTTTGINVAAFTNTIGWFTNSANSWVQFGLQNTNTGVGASTDFIAYANNGNNDTGWIDMGITGQNYVNQNGQYGVTGPNDGYLFMSGVAGSNTGGNLVIATGNTGLYNDIVIVTGGFDTIHEQARFIDGVGLKLIQGTPSINPTTGALIVQGGVGIGGNLNVQGDISLNGNLFLTGNAITFNTNNLSITDSLIYLADSNGADVLDIGFIGAFTNPGYQHTGFVRDATDGTWKLFANVVAEPVTTVDFTNATYSNLKIGNLSAVSAGFDSNVTAAYLIGTLGTAAQPLVTSLGTLTALSSSGLINTSGNVLASTVRGSFLTASTVAVGNIAAVTIGNSGATVTGTVGAFSGNVIGGLARFAALNSTPIGNATASSGAFTSLSASSTFYANSTTASTTTTTGAIVVAGGVGIDGNISAGDLAIPGAQHTFWGNLIVNGIGAVQVPAGTTLQRPGSTTAGQIRFNTDTNSFEGYGNTWAAIGGGGGGSTPGGVTTTIQYNAGGVLGGIASMNYILANGAIIISTGTSSTSTGTGALQIVGGLGITENINAGGYVKVTGAVNTDGNVLASQVSAGSVVTTGVVNAGGNLLAQAAIVNYLDVNGNIVVGDIGTPGAGHSIIGNITQSGAGTVYFNTPGNIMALQGSFGSINSTSLTVSDTANIQSTTTATNSATGALRVMGGVGVGGNLHVWQNASIGGALMQYGKLTVDVPTTSTSTTTGALVVTGGAGIGGAVYIGGTLNTAGVVPTTSNTYTLGSTTLWYTKTFTKAAVAQYADLAENYSSDRDYIPGTVLVFGGDKEVTISTESHDPAIAGVVSTNPAYHMNAQAEGVAVALQGRVPTKVKGPVRKGDRVVSSSIQGAAERLDMTKYQPGCIIGKALEDILDDSIQTIEVVVGRL